MFEAFCTVEGNGLEVGTATQEVSEIIDFSVAYGCIQTALTLT